MLREDDEYLLDMMDLVPTLIVIRLIVSIPRRLIRGVSAVFRGFKRLFQACIGYEGTNGAAY